MLQSLEIHALRGATNPLILSFEKNKKIAILYGENGTGKSTICDAIELIASDSIGSLENKGIGKTAPYWHSTGKQPSDVCVQLKTTNGQWEGRISKAKPVITPNSPRPSAKLLRRSQILELIATQPKNRFDAVRPFLDIDDIEKSEAALRKLLDQETKGRDTALARIEENRAAVENFWKEAGCPGSDPIIWARSEMGKDISSLEKQARELGNLSKLIMKAIEDKGRWEQVKQELASSQQKLEKAIARVSQEQATAAMESDKLVRLLETTQSFLSGYSTIEACPVCGSRENAATLLDDIKNRLLAMQSLRDAMNDQEQIQRNFDNTTAQLERQKLTFLSIGISLATAITAANQSVLGIETPKPLTELSNFVIREDVNESEKLRQLDELATDAAEFCAQLEQASIQTTEETGFIQTLRRQVADYDVNYAAQKDLDILIPRIENALKEMEDVRREFVDDILGSIANRVGALYEAIHPGEGLSKVSLLLDPSKRASLDITAPFPQAVDVPPGAYFSESHLDTLGLCTWLALAELNDPSKTILVLDDVIASVDDRHAERTIELLYDVAQNFQYCIYTTHYRPWREKYHWGWLKNGQCQFIELLPWDHTTGIRHTNHVPPVEELRSLLNASTPNSQLICACAGVILEAILDFLTELYECSVPRRRGKPTLGDLLPSVKGKLRSSLKIERLDIDSSGNVAYSQHELKPLLDELEKLMRYRNIFGCHFNELAAYLPEQDAIKFASNVLLLADLLIDTEQGWPKKDKSGSYWANAKETRKLHPLKQPS